LLISIEISKAESPLPVWEAAQQVSKAGDEVIFPFQLAVPGKFIFKSPWTVEEVNVEKGLVLLE